jgi:hypothetical protein
MKNHVTRMYAWAGLLTFGLLMLASPASAQYRPRPLNDPATGEAFHIEGSASWWYPSADMNIASEGFGIPGTTIDFKRDLGMTDQSFPALSVVGKVADRHKFRMQYIPISYQAESTLRRDIVFNGQRYLTNLPVNSDIEWRAFRFNYEFDFVKKNRGYAGFIVEAKYTDIRADLKSPIASEFARARFPVPALGGVGRVYVVPNISVTGEFTGFTIPDTIDGRYSGHYFDFDLYGTVNFTNNIGVQGGFRSLDLGYLIKTDTGSLTLKGIYFGVVARY